MFEGFATGIIGGFLKALGVLGMIVGGLSWLFGAHGAFAFFGGLVFFIAGSYFKYVSRQTVQINQKPRD